jgi:hypothetical protein
MTATPLEPKPTQKAPLADRRHFVHKRLDRWIRLQQFVYGLPDDYSYAACIAGRDVASSQVLVNVGWMCWFGQGKGAHRQHALAVSLLHSEEAASASPSAVFFHRLQRIVRSVQNVFNRKERKKGLPVSRALEERELLA